MRAQIPGRRRALQSAFESTYRAFPVAAIGKESLEYGDKVVLPASALDRLLKAQIDYPMLFKVSNPRAQPPSGSSPSSLHCGVMEFVAEEGMAYLPYWLMQSLSISEGGLVTFANITLPKGNYVKLRPQTKDFLDVSNPKAVLEKNLRLFTCLTQGGTVPIIYNSKRFLIDIVELKPAHAVSIVETDCDTDFEKPLDYVEDEEEQQRIGDDTDDTALQRPADGSAPQQQDEADADPSFVAFSGSAKRLDGRPAASAPTHEQQQHEQHGHQQHRGRPSGSSSGSNANKRTMEEQQKEQDRKREEQKREQEQRKTQGKLVFGASRPAPNAGANNKDGDNSGEKKNESGQESNFEAFKGKPRTLKD